MNLYYKNTTIDLNDNGYDWKNKKVIFFGDSITDGVSGYRDYVCEKIGGAIPINKANSGLATFPDYWSYKDREGITQHHLDIDYRRKPSMIPADIDLIIITGDVNGNSVNGKYNDTGKETWFGRWNDSISAMHKSFPEIPILLVSEYCMTKNETNYQMAEAMRQVSEFNGCPYVNIQNESQLNLKYSKKFGQTANDNTHVSKKYMPLFADFVVKKIKELKPFDFSGTDTIELNKTSTTLLVNNTEDLIATTTGDSSVAWTSDNMDVACVMGGKVYGMTAGTAIITATTRNGHTATCEVTVTE